MQYRIKVIEYESGRKEYVPQVRRWWGWQSGEVWDYIESAERDIEIHDYNIKNKLGNRLKSVTYKPVEP